MAPFGKVLLELGAGLAIGLVTLGLLLLAALRSWAGQSPLLPLLVVGLVVVAVALAPVDLDRKLRVTAYAVVLPVCLVLVLSG
jgi:hypothetical protein